MTQFYGAGRLIPPEVLLPIRIPDAEVLADWLGDRRGSAVHLRTPMRGPKAAAIRMASKTAEAGFRDSVRSMEERERAVEGLRRLLGLEQAPRIMECYDISNTQGAYGVGSLVTFEEGYPMPGRYRRFRIRTVSGANDPAMMRETKAALRDTGVSTLGGQSLTGFWNRHVEDVSIRTAQAIDQLNADSVVKENLQVQQQAFSGVNADEETIDLMSYQRMYQANARFLNVVDELMQTLIGIV